MAEHMNRESVPDELVDAFARIFWAARRVELIPELQDKARNTLAVAEAERNQVDRQLAFIKRVLGLFAAADEQGCLWWRNDDGEIRLFALVNDVFAWATADIEEITPDRLDVLQQAFDDLTAVGAVDYLPELYAARIRRMRPQGAVYPNNPAIRALYDACGPERPTGLDDPHVPPPANPSINDPKETT